MFRNIEKHLGKKIDIVLMEDFVTDSLRLEIEASELKSRQSGSRQSKKGSTTGRTAGPAKKELLLPVFQDGAKAVIQEEERDGLIQDRPVFPEAVKAVMQVRAGAGIILKFPEIQ